MNPNHVIEKILASRKIIPAKEKGEAYAPSNIALAKYWGKRDTQLNLPVTSSLSISLHDKGSFTTVSASSVNQDILFLNSRKVPADKNFAQRLSCYLDLFRPTKDFYFTIETTNTIPVAAGLASSASGFAALILALNDFFAWQLDDQSLSQLARLGSGSAARSLWQGFVEWHAGKAIDGSDCFAEKLPYTWPTLRIGLLIVSDLEKKISSREAMKICQQTSPFYDVWPTHVAQTIETLHKAIQQQDINLLGQTAEQNALAMHATMLTSNPPFCYWQTETLTTMQKIWSLRERKVPVYFTEDAGPNLKLLFNEEILNLVREEFPLIDIVEPF